MSTLGKHWKVKDTSKMNGFQKKHTEVTKEKMRKAKKRNPVRYWLGKFRSQETKDKIRKSLIGKPNGRLGKICSIDSRKRMSESHRGSKNYWYGKHLSEEHKKKLRNAHKGINNPNWLGGKSFEPYSVDWTKELRQAIRQRDNFTCQICGKYPAFDCHHIDYNKKNCEPNNLITLCKSCHSKTNKNRKYWIKYFYGNKLSK